MKVCKKLEIRGIVQGVGFRPFIYRLANLHGLKGYVQNSGEGVQLHIEGVSQTIEAFAEALHKELPPLARIDTIDIHESACAGNTEFKICKSSDVDEKKVLLSPDIAVCDRCLAEMKEPTNRRYGHPFINCTDCGPRYSIIQNIPYDRHNTSMRFFKMCKACEAEYTDPSSRRFHAQPISCLECGPTLRLLDKRGRGLHEGKSVIEMAIKALLDGKIIALKGLGGFHLVCDATNTKAVSLLRERKRRPSKPFAVMFPDIDMLKSFVEISAEEEELITSKHRPIVIVEKSNLSQLYDNVAPDIDRLGVMLPYTPLHHLLLEGVGRGIVVTSANLSDEPIITKSSDLVDKLGTVVDLILDHDREILNANDDSVMQIISSEKFFLRMSRGFAPKNIILPFKSPKKILALGAHQKDTITLVMDDRLVISPYIGDLNSIEAFAYFERTLETFQRVYDFKPDIIVCDKHPEYLTSRWAKEFEANDSFILRMQVQHHYAHILAVKAEHNLSGKVLGFAFDGTGYGDEGSIWGAEVMIADEQGYTRRFSLRPFRLLGGEKAVKEPRRSALSLLFEYYSLEEILRLDFALKDAFTADEISTLHKVWEKGLNAPFCSSMGRLFDAMASLAGILHVSSFEGESGLKMERHVDRSVKEHFSFSITEERIDLGPMLRALTKMKDTRQMVSMFFNTLVEIIVRISKEYPEFPLVFSGGVFQNKTLVEKIIQRMQETGRSVYFQNASAINDGGISLGQAWYALHNL